MALRFDWGQLSQPALSRVVLDTINGFLAKQRTPMQGGFAYLEVLDFGSIAPTISLASLSHLADDASEARVRLHFSYYGKANVKIHAYAQINTVRSRLGKAGDRGRFHMRSLDSFAPAFLPVWVELCHVHVDTDIILSLSSAPRALRVHLTTFPLKDVLVKTCFDGSVIAQKIAETANKAIEDARTALAAQGHDFDIPLEQITTNTNTHTNSAETDGSVAAASGSSNAKSSANGSGSDGSASDNRSAGSSSVHSANSSFGNINSDSGAGAGAGAAAAAAAVGAGASVGGSGGNKAGDHAVTDGVAIDAEG